MNENSLVRVRHGSPEGGDREAVYRGMKILLALTLCIPGLAGATCPDIREMAISGQSRTVDVATKPLDAAAYKHMKWAAAHNTAVGADFIITPTEAIERVIAIEVKHPEILPAGLRDRILAQPRDAALRLEAAECEKRWMWTGRRAMYDAALAALLKPDRAREARSLIKEANDMAASKEFYRLSPAEVEIEEALARAILPAYLKLPAKFTADLGNDVLSQTLVHHCGGRDLCQAQLDHDGKAIHSDVRDRGRPTAQQEKPVVLSPAARRKVCMRDTGFPTRDQCVAHCHVGATNRYRASARSNGTAMGVGDETENACKSDCERACP